MVWPWFERIEFLQHAKNFEFTKTKYPKLTSYVERMRKLPEIKAHYVDPEAYIEFYDAYFAKTELNFDAGIKEN